jgi:hypothetical protein
VKSDRITWGTTSLQVTIASVSRWNNTFREVKQVEGEDSWFGEERHSQPDIGHFVIHVTPGLSNHLLA